MAASVTQSQRQPDPELTGEQQSLVDALDDTDLRQIDSALLANTSGYWRKIAGVVGTTMSELPDRVPGIPDVFYAQRVKKLVSQGLLVAQGDLSCMRESEVKQPSDHE